MILKCPVLCINQYLISFSMSKKYDFFNKKTNLFSSTSLIAAPFNTLPSKLGLFLSKLVLSAMKWLDFGYFITRPLLNTSLINPFLMRELLLLCFIRKLLCRVKLKLQSVCLYFIIIKKMFA